MATLIIIFILLAGYHFIMEGIIIPTFRNELRYKLIKLRDKLFMLRIKEPGKVDEEAAENLNIMICIVANHTEQFEITDVLRHYKVIKKEVKDKENSNDFSANHSDEFKYIYKKTGDYLFRAFLFNSLAWAIYLLPFIILFGIIIIIISLFDHFIWKEIKGYFYKAQEKEMMLLMGKHDNCKEITIDGNPSFHLPRLSKNGIGRKLHGVS